MMWQTLQQRAVWQIYRAAERLGWQGLLAILLLLAVLPTYWFALRPMQQQLADLKQAVSAPVADTSISTQTPEQLLQTYLQSLPPIAQRASATQAVNQVAEQQDLILDEVTYKTDVQQDDPIAHYHMQFTLYASYPEIQRFLSHLLNELNYVAIESLTLSRENAKDEFIEARIDLVLHFNKTAINKMAENQHAN